MRRYLSRQRSSTDVLGRNRYSPSFFRVRLWTQKELLEQLFANYDRLDEELKAELPLKRAWMIAAQGELED